ncbi:PREDICTED: 41 kDa spicule matrix protein-like [Erythranthe guttata]|uniref:41 kDa spicule matrix protein-like n=1 Tax=Erythranthe guttata TaxID=4155 RepID=UPI00064D783E|nr:PREDICTED: 41 kDa spicule matrix protein-like [Erythranthe guttata]|eukprot:XP_012849609.1 PREDICTED: 41 kDa spicule matrix protein-like [Erythranthe guttata]
MLYTCTVCKDYFLHKQCFEMPKKIDHLCHKKHGLTLLPKPAYKQDYFVCNACGESGVGFSYNCGRCDVDLHITCALLPLFVKHKSHAHKLDLTFESPYPSKSFTCAICDAPGSRHWLYRCKLCEFNAHLTCARSVDQTLDAPPMQPKEEVSLIGFDESRLISPKAAPPDSVASCSGLTPTAPQLPPLQQPNIMTNNVALGVASGVPMMQPRFHEMNRQMVNNDLALHVVKQWIINNIDAIALGILSGRGSGGGGFGGGYGGNNMGAGLQQVMMQLMCNGGTSGGGIPAFGGYGGVSGGGDQGSSPAVTSSQVSMQAVIGGGGGGGGGCIPGLSGFVGGGGGGIPGLSGFVGGGGGDIPGLSGFVGGGPVVVVTSLV